MINDNVSLPKGKFYFPIPGIKTQTQKHTYIYIYIYIYKLSIAINKLLHTQLFKMSHTGLSFHRSRVQANLNWVSCLDSQKAAIKASARLCSYLEAWSRKNLILNLLRLLSEKAMATNSSTLAWRIPGARQPGGLPSIVSQSQT